MRICASIAYQRNQHPERIEISYHAESFDKGDNQEESLILSDGIRGSLYEAGDPFITWAETGCSSPEELAKEIYKGANEHNLRSFNFIFDYPENFYVEDKVTYWHGRPLTQDERERFIKSYCALCTFEQ